MKSKPAATADPSCGSGVKVAEISCSSVSLEQIEALTDVAQLPGLSLSTASLTSTPGSVGGIFPLISERGRLPLCCCETEVS